ncbi:MAG TPA: 3-oxoadipate enol-lactonase [Streptosporangiaceae bacterium]
MSDPQAPAAGEIGQAPAEAARVTPGGRQSVRLAATLDGPRDAPVLVLGNSLGTTRELWEPQIAALGEHFRLLRYEHRGHGGSPAPPGRYTIADLGADVLRLLDDFGVEHASYCGVSLGGMVGMWLAANAPGRIDALGLCCTSARFPDRDPWVQRAAAVRADGLPPISAQIVSRWFTSAFVARYPSVPADLIATLDGVDPQGYAGCCDAIADMDLQPVLAEITAPTLVISGSEDPATPPWHGAVMARGITGSRLAVIRGASHLANVSAPGEVAAALTAHLLAVAPAAWG